MDNPRRRRAYTTPKLTDLGSMALVTRKSGPLWDGSSEQNRTP
jgi:hypothetical protein